MGKNGVRTVPDYEADHRVSNHLSIISALLRRRAKGLGARTEPVDGAEAKRTLEEAAFQIEVIASLHRLLSDKPRDTNINLDQYLRSVCNAAVPSLSMPGHVRPEYILSCGKLVAPDFAVSIALAVAELITNSIKYAHPSGVDGTIMVAATCRGDHLVIEVADDGVGLPEGYDPLHSGSLGLRLVRSTAERWGGAVEFEANDLGLRVRLFIPVGACQGSVSGGV